MKHFTLLMALGLFNVADDGTGGGGGGSAQPANTPPAGNASPPTNTPPTNTPPTNTPPPAPAPVPLESSDNPAVDMVMSTIHAAKVDIPDAVWDAAEQGNFDMLQLLLAKSDLKGQDQLISILKRAHSEAVATAQENAKKAHAAAVEIAGSVEQWGHINKWFNDNADADEKSYIGEQLTNPIGARMAAAYLTGLYNTHNGSANRGDAVTNPHVAPAAPNNTPITRAELAQHANRLYHIHGNGYINTPEYQSLLKRLV